MSFQILFARFAVEDCKTPERMRFSLPSLAFAINAERHFFPHFSWLVTQALSKVKALVFNAHAIQRFPVLCNFCKQLNLFRNGTQLLEVVCLVIGQFQGSGLCPANQWKHLQIPALSVKWDKISDFHSWASFIIQLF